MLKSIFWFAPGVAVTLVFAVAMIFIFGPNNRVICKRQQPGQASCTVSNVVLGLGAC